MAARQLPHCRNRRPRHPPRSAAVVLPPPADHRRRRVRRGAADLRPRPRSDSIERGTSRRRTAVAVSHRVSVGDPADDRRALGVAERAQAGAGRAPEGQRRHVVGREGAPPARRSGRRRARTRRVRAGRGLARSRASGVRDAPAAALPRVRRCGVRAAAPVDRGPRQARSDGRGCDSRGRPEPGGRAGVDGQSHRQPAPDLVVRLERVLRERQPGRARAASRPGRRLQPHGLPQPRPLSPRGGGAGGADRRSATPRRVEEHRVGQARRRNHLRRARGPRRLLPDRQRPPAARTERRLGAGAGAADQAAVLSLRHRRLPRHDRPLDRRAGGPGGRVRLAARLDAAPRSPSSPRSSSCRPAS